MNFFSKIQYFGRELLKGDKHTMMSLEKSQIRSEMLVRRRFAVAFVLLSVLVPPIARGDSPAPTQQGDAESAGEVTIGEMRRAVWYFEVHEKHHNRIQELEALIEESQVLSDQITLVQQVVNDLRVEITRAKRSIRVWRSAAGIVGGAAIVLTIILVFGAASS
jgi:hypothetical protein